MPSEEETVGSDSDSERGEDGRVGGGSISPNVLLQSNSMEVSLWSLDVSMPSGMESSVYDTEVRTGNTYNVHVHRCMYMYLYFLHVNR